ncbi:MAG: sigma-70 family RNA polymerase sigma factor [Actinophytocola sp.]|uniref:RNA polymerase sigma factor n=1 Tax=Actinophytocola sp. TaxID=1872138 RepID=UPI00132A96CA|nr:sigma-70 family RNA polymerase sigma factor [Actinophytocola sp.]MPZ82628.1 sigma-70 family RNA polymerase sigma factor [Actinophytocola sp.]
MVAEVNYRPTPVNAGAPPLEALLERQWMPLVRLAALLVNDADTAPDIVQDCYEAVWRLRPNVEDYEHFVAYLRKAVLNRSRSRLRRLRTVNRFLAQARPGADMPPADRPLLVAEQHRELLGHVDLLPTRQREVIVLRYYCELSEAETAATIGISVGTVKSSAHRALATLRRKMKDISDER